eukprot:TRINITY_DN31315_c0_g1_i1.p1 TRINITY_DN31315_c0_g1~~TRINITY_DN31315_c0_g1_i1.p1  ORF type:complete len:287 (-),score=37.15 TRINITY_DN31315_c0_g1_i1:379-1239(-)
MLANLSKSFFRTPILLLWCVIGLNGDQVVQQQFDFQVLGYDLTLYLTLPSSTPPSTTKFVLFLNGFECRAAWYQPYVEALVKEGYAVIQFDQSEFDMIDDVTELSFFDSIRNWLLVDYQPSVGLQLNLEDFALVGHSRGGKLAALMYVKFAEYVSTVYLIDPVDNTQYTKGSEGYPSAVAALKGLNKPMGITGAGISGECNPVSANYLKFWEVADQQTSSLHVVHNSGHMQFCQLPFYLQPVFDELCGYGQNTDKETIESVLEVMIPWLNTHFKDSEEEDTTLVQM